MQGNAKQRARQADSLGHAHGERWRRGGCSSQGRGEGSVASECARPSPVPLGQEGSCTDACALPALTWQDA